MPSVSIVLPTYNGQQYLSKALDSIISQTMTDWELIIVDDCSSDDTPTIAQTYAQKDSRITYHRNESNKKLPASLNIGFDMARAPYLTWTSDDNIMEPSALDTLLTTLKQHPEYDLAYCNMKIIDENDNVIRINTTLTSQSFLYCYNVVGACFLYRASIKQELNGYDPNLFLVEDYDYWLRAYRSHRFIHIKQAPYRYRTHSASLSKTRERDIRERTCQLLRREMSLPRLGFKKKCLLLAGYVYNLIRYRIVRD